MSTDSSCRHLTISDAITKLPNPEGKRFATIFQHGSLLAATHNSRTRVMKHILSPRAAAIMYAARAAQLLFQLIYCLPQRESRIGSRISLTI
jgi:hypothetical protein